MSPIAAGIGGVLIGLAVGWFIGHSARGSGSGTSPEVSARQRAMEEENRRLAHELSKAQDLSESDISSANETAESTAVQNRKLLRRVRDLENALTLANAKVDTPVATLQMQLTMAMRERDAAQKALMELEARNAIDRSRPPPGEYEPDDFPELPELDDTDETEEKPAPGFQAEPTLIPEMYAEDDLTALTGVGPATAKKLRAHGIHSFAQLAALTDEQVAEVEQQLGSKRASKDDWRGQATALLSSGQEE